LEDTAMGVAYQGPQAPDLAGVRLEVRQPMLLRRLMIRCPVHGVPTDTGFELSSIPAVNRSEQLLVNCLACGQDHVWQIADAFLE
jgi:hypothetical protein